MLKFNLNGLLLSSKIQIFKAISTDGKYNKSLSIKVKKL